MSLAKWASMSALNEKRDKRKTGLPSGFVFQPQSPNSPTVSTREPLSSSLLNREPRRRSMYNRFNSRNNLNNSNNCQLEDLPYVITPSHHYYWPIKSLFYQDQSKSSIFDQSPKGVAVDILGNCLIRPDILLEQIDLSECWNLEVDTFYAYQVPKVAVTTFYFIF